MVQENRLYLVDTGVIGQNVWPHEHRLTKSFCPITPVYTTLIIWLDLITEQ